MGTSEYVAVESAAFVPVAAVDCATVSTDAGDAVVSAAPVSAAAVECATVGTDAGDAAIFAAPVSAAAVEFAAGCDGAVSSMAAACSALEMAAVHRGKRQRVRANEADKIREWASRQILLSDSISWTTLMWVSCNYCEVRSGGLCSKHAFWAATVSGADISYKGTHPRGTLRQAVCGTRQLRGDMAIESSVARQRSRRLHAHCSTQC